jgi:hypothetical protein
MITKADVRETVERLAGVYARLRKTDELRQEIGHALMRHADRLEVADLYAGTTALIESMPTRQADGGPSSPPGPHEVVGCVLTARRARLNDAPAIRYSLAQGTRDKIRQGFPVTTQEANARDIWQPGITFSAWWSSLTLREQHDHATLREYMVKDADLIPVNA